MPKELSRIDDWRFENHITSRAEAIRQLIRLGLDASEDGAAGVLFRRPEMPRTEVLAVFDNLVLGQTVQSNSLPPQLGRQDCAQHLRLH